MIIVMVIMMTMTVMMMNIKKNEHIRNNEYQQNMDRHAPSKSIKNVVSPLQVFPVTCIMAVVVVVVMVVVVVVQGEEVHFTVPSRHKLFRHR